jgi:xylulose-5-phosphate/fructose-6-phosphate phosphoketolase
MPNPLPADLLKKMHAYWCAANYLSVGQIYLQDNPLLETPLTLEHIKPRLFGHWGTTTGLNFLYVHLNRLIKDNDLNMIYVIGAGHGGPGIVAHSYLEGSYTEHYPAIERWFGAAVPPVFLALRHSKSRCTGNSGVDP